MDRSQMTKRPDPHALVMAHVKATQNTKKWAMVAKGHLDAGRREQAAKALKKAEFWEKKLKKLGAPAPRSDRRKP